MDQFAVAGASYGGLVAFRYASTRTSRVTALILQNSAGIEYGGRGGTTERPRDPDAQFEPSPVTEDGMETILNIVINDPEVVTPELITRKTDFNNLVGRDCEAFLARQLYERGNPQRVLEQVRAPALVLWGGGNKALSLSTADAFANGLKNAAVVRKIIHDGGGHLLHIERPEATSRDVKAFLDTHLAR
ncbi:MAG: alpha/beta hydrolase [Chromatocurvus sp.]